MEKNLSQVGRALRGIIAALLFLYAYQEKSWVALAFSIFTFYEALASWCVLYQIFGWNSCPLSERKKP